MCTAISQKDADRIKEIMLEATLDKSIVINIEESDMFLEAYGVSEVTDTEHHEGYDMKEFYILGKDNEYGVLKSRNKLYNAFVNVGEWGTKTRLDKTHITLGCSKFHDFCFQIELSQAIKDDDYIYILKNITNMAGSGAICRLYGGLKGDKAKKLKRQDVFIKKYGNEVRSYKGKDWVVISKIRTSELYDSSKESSILYDLLYNMFKAMLTVESVVETITYDKLSIDLKEYEKPKQWLIVHNIDTYKENPRLIGFSDKIYNAKHIKPNDFIVYYLSGSSSIKGIYKVNEKPWDRNKEWVSEHQIGITPVIELENELDFKKIVSKISLFKNKENWSSYIQGKNAVRELSSNDYDILLDYVIKSMIENKESEYVKLEEDDSSLVNETIEVKVNRIKRYQHIVSNLKDKYENRCQVEGCNFTFKKKNGEYYSEAHHLVPLSKGGSQESSNVVILCPNHHRMFHYADVIIDKQKGNRREVIINGEKHYIVY